MRMHVPLATLAQLLPRLSGDSLSPAQLGEQLGITPQATVTSVDVDGDAAVLHVEGVDPGLADADGWVTAEWSIDAKGRPAFGGFKAVEPAGAVPVATLAQLLGAPAPAAGSEESDATKGGRRRGGSA